MFSKAKTVSLGSKIHADNTKDNYQIMLSGEGTGYFVPYQVLEAAVTVDAERVLLFLTDDVPYEEILYITLLHVTKGILETLSLGGAYTTGTFSDMHVLPDAVEFRFIGDTTWKVDVTNKPFLKIPFVGDPRGVSRSRAFAHYLKISADPSPAHADGSR